MQKNEINFKNLPEKYQNILKDKNKNGKPDFFEDTPINIIKKLINLFTQKDPHLYGYKKVNPSGVIILLFIIIAIAISLFAAKLMPFVIFFGIAYFSNNKKDKANSKNKTAKVKIDPTEKSFIQTQNNQKPPSNFSNQPSSFNPTNNIQDSFSNGIRVILFIGLIAYCLYLVWPYLQNHFS